MATYKGRDVRILSEEIPATDPTMKIQHVDPANGTTELVSLGALEYNDEEFTRHQADEKKAFEDKQKAALDTRTKAKEAKVKSDAEAKTKKEHRKQVRDQVVKDHPTYSHAEIEQETNNLIAAEDLKIKEDLDSKNLNTNRDLNTNRNLNVNQNPDVTQNPNQNRGLNDVDSTTQPTRFNQMSTHPRSV